MFPGTDRAAVCIWAVSRYCWEAGNVSVALNTASRTSLAFCHTISWVKLDNPIGWSFHLYPPVVCGLSGFSRQEIFRCYGISWVSFRFFILYSLFSSDLLLIESVGLVSFPSHLLNGSI